MLKWFFDFTEQIRISSKYAYFRGNPINRLLFLILFVLAACDAPTNAIVSRGGISPQQNFRWVNLPAVAPSISCSRSRFNRDLAIVRSPSNAAGLKTPRDSASSDDVDQITGRSTNRDAFESALENVGSHSICAMKTSSGRAQIVDLLDYLAARDALVRSGAETAPSPQFYAVNRLALAYVAIAPYTEIAADRRQRIESWLNRRVAELTPADRSAPMRCSKTPSRNHNCSNWGAVTAHTTMVWGAYQGDARMLNHGVDRYMALLQGMRQDGSVPEDARRGCRALLYSRYTIGIMAHIAEIARRHGVNLYDVSVDGKSLETGVTYLLRVKDNNSLIVPYAKGRMDPSIRDGCPNGRQVQSGFNESAVLWPYALRGGDHPTAVRVRSGLSAAGTRASVFEDTNNIPYLWTVNPG